MNKIMDTVWQWLEKIFGNGRIALPPDRNVVYSKPGCEHCARAKELLNDITTRDEEQQDNACGCK